jgi:hypothetical protein
MFEFIKVDIFQLLPVTHTRVAIDTLTDWLT